MFMATTTLPVTHQEYHPLRTVFLIRQLFSRCCRISEKGLVNHPLPMISARILQPKDYSHDRHRHQTPPGLPSLLCR